MQRLTDYLKVVLPGLGLKRWLLVIFLGLLQMAGGVMFWIGALLRRTRHRSLITALESLPGFPLGLTFLGSGAYVTYWGWQQLSRSIMRVMLPERSETELVQVIRQRQRAARGRRVVVIGGDPGLTPIIKALQLMKEDIRIDVILPVADYGHLPQDLRDKFGLSGQQIIYPTDDDAILYAELEDGRLLEGATTINRYNGGKIADLFLSRDIRRVQVWEQESNGQELAKRLRKYMPGPSEAALEALNQAELILFAPGRFYTQLLPVLTLPRFAQTLRESRAPKAYVANLMSEPGRTDGWTVNDYIETIQKISGVTIDYVIVHQGSKISEAMLAQYHNEGSDVIGLEQDEGTSRLIFADTGEQTTLVGGAVAIGGDILTEKPQVVTFQHGESTILREMPVVRHDPEKLAPLLLQLLTEDR